MEPSASLNFYDFLDKMRHTSAIDLVRSIKRLNKVGFHRYHLKQGNLAWALFTLSRKPDPSTSRSVTFPGSFPSTGSNSFPVYNSFIVSFSFNTYDAERDSKRLQDFLVSTEAIIRHHPLWTGVSEEEIDNAVEGLEKYLMAKLFNHVFASVPEDSKHDMEITEKIRLLQCFIKPEHLDIPKHFQNEASWLLAEKELQKINAYKAPREKLMCIVNCCLVINNLLLNVSMSSYHKPAGADDFLPVLIYVVIKANPPQLHSNLKYIQLYRRHSRLTSEAAYYFTTMLSVKSFIVYLSAKSLSLKESEYEGKMQAAWLSFAVPERCDHADVPEPGTLPAPVTGPVVVQEAHEAKSCGRVYPFMEAEIGDLRVEEVEHLLHLYKDVVLRYSRLCDAVRSHSLDRALALVHMDERTQIASKFSFGANRTENSSGQHVKR